MRLTAKERKKATAIVSPRYQKARKKDKGLILDEFTELTGYGRRYASHLLTTQGRKVWVNETTVLKGDVRKHRQRRKEPIYDKDVLEALKKVWAIMDYICCKRLAPVLKEIIIRLEWCREIRVSDKVQEKLFRISPATIDRLLAKERKKQQIKGRSNTMAIHGGNSWGLSFMQLALSFAQAEFGIPPQPC